jgi:aminopeptidase N
VHPTQYILTGPEKFQEGLQVYMRKHAYGNTETVDLWNCWSQVSGKDVAGLMKAWTTVMGYPVVRVVEEKWSDAEVEITLEQSRFLSDGQVAAEDDQTLWSIPLLFASAGSTSQEAVVMSQKRQTFAVPVSAGSAGKQPWVKINAGQKALARVAHSPDMTARLVSSIRDVAPIDRAALLLDAYALAKAGVAPLEDVVNILRALQGEDAPIVMSAIAGILSSLHMLMEELGETNKEVFVRFMAFGKNIVLSSLERVRDALLLRSRVLLLFALLARLLNAHISTARTDSDIGDTAATLIANDVFRWAGPARPANRTRTS